MGSEGEPTQRTSGPDVPQPGTEGGMLLGWRRSGISSFEVIRQRTLLVNFSSWSGVVFSFGVHLRAVSLLFTTCVLPQRHQVAK